MNPGQLEGPQDRPVVGTPPRGVPTSPTDQRSLTDPDVLFELYDHMLGDVEIPAVLRDVADVVCEKLNAERATVFLIDRATAELESIALIGNVTRMIRVPIDAMSLAGCCALRQRPLVVPDAYGDLSTIDPEVKFDRSWDDRNDFRTRDVLCAPALFKGELIGVVQVINRKGAPFSEADLRALVPLARLIGYALHQARLCDDLATMKGLEKQKAQFMRIMIHELKSPVAAAKMMADALQYDDDVANSSAGEVTAKISRRMGHLMELIGDLLHLAKVKSGEPLGEIAIIDLVAVTGAGCESYREPAARKGLALQVELPGQPVQARFDSQGYGLVLSNLVSNAIKYTATGGVTVRLRAEDGWAVLEVADTGMGIPEKDVPKLFGEFFRASNAKRAHIEGSGVGLAGARSLVERFGGEFALETQENEGATFTVRLPLCLD